MLLLEGLPQRSHLSSPDNRSLLILSSSPPPSTKALCVGARLSGRSVKVLYAPPPEIKGFKTGMGKRNLARYGISHAWAGIVALIPFVVRSYSDAWYRPSASTANPNGRRISTAGPTR